MIIGLFSSNLILSIATISLVVLGIFQTKSLHQLRETLKTPLVVGFALIFLIYLISGIASWSLDSDFWMDKVRVKLPFLVLPAAMLILPGLDRRSIAQLLIGFVVLALMSASFVWVRYLLNSAYYEQFYSQGIAIPTPVNHIRYSLIIALAMSTCLWLSRPAQSATAPFDLKWGRLSSVLRQRLFIAAGIFFLIFLHVLAVRSGLLAAYLVLIYWLGSYLFREKKIITSLIICALSAALAWAALEYVPTLKNRIAYTRYDLEQFFKGQANPDLSDAKRIGSILAGVEIVKEHPILGVGLGSVRSQLRIQYAQRFPDLVESTPLPHNQFVFIAAVSGLTGLMVFLLATVLPFLQQHALQSPIFIGINIIFISSMFTEATLETQLGVSLYLLFILLIYRYLQFEGASDQPARVEPDADAKSRNRGLWQEEN